MCTVPILMLVMDDYTESPKLDKEGKMTEEHLILRDREQAYIDRLLKKYRGEVADDTLKKAIFEDLQKEKFLGNIKIPFKVILKNGVPGKFPPCVEVVLDSKV